MKRALNNKMLAYIVSLLFIHIPFTYAKADTGDFLGRFIAGMFDGKTGGGSGGDKDRGTGAFGIGFGDIKNISNNTVDETASKEELKNVRSFFYQSDYGKDAKSGFVPFVEFSYLDTRDAKATWESVAATPVDIYLVSGTIGIKLQVPTEGFRPFITAGYHMGNLTVSNPATSTKHHLDKLNDDETKFTDGFAGGAGFDIDLGKMGLRFSYTYITLNSDPYQIFSGKSFDFDYNRAAVAIFFRR